MLYNYNYEYSPWLLTSATLYNKTNRYFYVKLLLSQTLEFVYAFCGTGITIGAQYATLTVQSHQLSSGRFFL